MKKIFLVVLASLLALGIYLYVYLGFSEPVAIARETLGPYHLLYKEHIGPYHEMGPTLNEVESWAHAQNLACPQTFGEYLDDPEAVDQDRLRSRAGCVLRTAPTNVPESFAYELREKKTYVVARFRGSPAIGPFTVYPKVESHMQAERLKVSGPVIEIYNVSGSRVLTEYLFPIQTL
ncbi:MAG: GyrI-like domain-containing protein [Bdellovibrionales bacterium]